jgi:hypothetical protein
MPHLQRILQYRNLGQPNQRHQRRTQWLGPNSLLPSSRRFSVIPPPARPSLIMPHLQRIHQYRNLGQPNPLVYPPQLEHKSGQCHQYSAWVPKRRHQRRTQWLGPNSLLPSSRRFSVIPRAIAYLLIWSNRYPLHHLSDIFLIPLTHSGSHSSTPDQWGATVAATVGKGYEEDIRQMMQWISVAPDEKTRSDCLCLTSGSSPRSPFHPLCKCAGPDSEIFPLLVRFLLL